MAAKTLSEQIPYLGLLYRWGRLPMGKVWGNGRILAVGPEGMLEKVVDDNGHYHCILCGVDLRFVDHRRRYFCPECEKVRINTGSDNWSAFRFRVLKRDNNECVNCHCSLDTNFVCDHIIPLFKGGRDWWEDAGMTNFQTLCPECNAKKTGMDLSKPKKPLEMPKDYSLDKFLFAIVDDKKSEVKI